MGKGREWFPHREMQLVELMKAWQAALADASLRARYGWPDAECVRTLGVIAAFLSAREAYRVSPTEGNCREKNGRKREAAAAMRGFARDNVRFNPAMETGAKSKLGMREADPVPTPLHAPETGPASRIELDAEAPAVLRIRYLGAKPYGVDRVEIAYAVAEAGLKAAPELTRTESFSRNPWRHTFSDSERGKRFYYALRYLAKRSESSWSRTEEIIVP